jgi:proteasome lid subunit RPN8/RPN11
MTIRMTQDLIHRISRHGEAAYPQECCGFLLGRVEEGMNVLSDLWQAKNEWQNVEGAHTPDGRIESRDNRYLISGSQYKQADAEARKRGLGIIGYYHSHPDHPAVPSRFDLDHSCWPGESYIIVSIQNGIATQLNSFTKPNYESFEQEEMVIEDRY